MSIKSRWLDKASISAAVLGAIAALISFVITFTAENFKTIEIDGIEFQTKPPSTIYLEDTVLLKKEVVSIKTQLTNLTSIPKDSAVSARLSKIESHLSSLDKNITIINKAIMQSPEKALELPMLRRDIASLQKQYESATKSLEREISRAYDTIKWVIGTIVLGILGLAASVFLRERNEQNS